YQPNPYPVRPFVYDPHQDRITWLEDICFKRQSLDDDATNDAVACLGEWVYFADKGGNLSRVHFERFTVEYLGKPVESGRLTSLIEIEGALWGVAGDQSDVYIVRVDPGGNVERLGPIVADDGERPVRLHEI